MSKKFVFELFPSSISAQADPNHFIEVFDFHEGTYGTIFYKGQQIYQYQGEEYYAQITSYSKVKQMVALGLDLTKAKVAFYELALIKDDAHTLPNFNYEDSQFSPYSKLLQDFQADLLPMEAIIKTQEAKYIKMNPRAKVRFLHFHDVDF